MNTKTQQTLLNKLNYGYKVVSNDLKSIIHKNSSIAVQYKLNEWVFPTINNSLMCFNNLHYANNWKITYGGLIYQCEYILEPNPIFITQNLFSDRLIEISKAINLLQISGYKIESKNEHAPTGTLFCSSIKLIQLI